MDQWFNQLFEIIGSQSQSKKTEMLLPEIYSELDILTRKQNIEELHEIYEFVENKNPIKTEDNIYNNKAYIKLKKEIIKRHVLLRDFSIINRQINDFLLNNDQKGIKELLNLWKDSKYIYNHIQEIIFNSKKAKRVTNPETVKRTVKIKPPVQKVEPIEDFKPKTSKPEIKKEIAFSTATEELEIVKEEIKPKKIIEEPIIQKAETKPKQVIEEKVIQKQETKLEPLNKPVEPYKPKVEVKIPEPIEKEFESFGKDKPVETVSPGDPYTLFFECVSIIANKYKMTVNVEMLKKLSNPKPNFSRFLLQHIDEHDRNAKFFIDLFKLLTEYKLIDIITYIINKSFKIKTLCTYNIGLLNEDDLKNKFKLLDIVIRQDFDFIKMSNHERKVRTYVDNLFGKDNITEDMKNKVIEISKFAPLMMQTFYASEAISLFKINVYSLQDRIIKEENLSHLYWAMLLAACLCIYVVRDKYIDFVASMDCVAEMANLLIKKTDDIEIKLSVKVLASSYIRRIYKIATDLPEYIDWWDRHKDDMLESKHKGLALLNPID